MKRAVLLFILALLVIIGFRFMRFDMAREPKKLSCKFVFSEQDKKSEIVVSLQSLAIKDDYLFVADSGNNRIQILKINPDGNLSPKFAFGREGKELGEFIYPFSLAIKDDYLFVADSGNNRIQVVEIKY